MDAKLDLPGFTGTIAVDVAAREACAVDFGGIVSHQPRLVLRPATVDDVVIAVRWAIDNQVPLSARGAGHSTYGQAQVADGVVLDMTGLAAIHDIAADHIVVEAGTLWSQVVTATLAVGLTPPVLTDYLELTIGGTLTVGGIGGASHHHGMQVDTVLALEVVTGAGELVTCTPELNSDLFRNVLGGLGQCAVIVRATVRLLPAPQLARRYKLFYRAFEQFMADQRRAATSQRFDYLEGQVVDGDGTWLYLLEAVTFYNPDQPPRDEDLIADLAFDSQEVEDTSYYDFLDRMRPAEALLRSTGDWSRPHPWLDFLLPDATVDAVVSATMAELTRDTLGAMGVVLLYPVLRPAPRVSIVQLPPSELVWSFSLLRFAPTPDAAVVDTMITANQAVYDRARAAGGYLYAANPVPMNPTRWKAHFGSDWEGFLAATRQYDPQQILAHGQQLKADRP